MDSGWPPDRACHAGANVLAIREIAVFTLMIAMLLLSQAFANEEPLSLYVLDCGSMHGMESAPFLSGDLFHSQLNRSLHVAPEFNVDREQTLESMRVIEEFVTAHDAQLWIQHGPGSGPAAPSVLR